MYSLGCRSSLFTGGSLSSFSNIALCSASILSLAIFSNSSLSHFLRYSPAVVPFWKETVVIYNRYKVIYLSGQVNAWYKTCQIVLHMIKGWKVAPDLSEIDWIVLHIMKSVLKTSYTIYTCSLYGEYNIVKHRFRPYDYHVCKKRDVLSNSIMVWNFLSIIFIVL